MKKEFVPYELVLRLKAIGFDEPCFGTYCSKNFQLYEVSNARDVKVPTYSQTFRWFREKYQLIGYSYPNEYQKYGYRLTEVKVPENEELFYDWGTKDTYEEAELACLYKLIEYCQKLK